MTKEEFIKEINNFVEHCPKGWRKGQSVFNVIDSQYGVARAVQFEDNVDCFYDDDNINKFINCAYNRINKALNSYE